MHENKAVLDIPKVSRTCMQHGYMLDKKLGRGGNASVFLVKSLKYNCDFCVKVSHSADKSTERDNEIQTLMNLNHPNIVRIYEFFEDDEYFYMILEYCVGGSLYDLVAHEGALPYERLVPMCVQICEAVKAFHEQHVAHRDIKPANILLDMYGRPKLADFGLSGFFQGDTTVKSHAGSLAFMDPEIWKIKTGHNPFKSDIWALGVTFFYLATGRLPWETSSMQEMLKSCALGYVDYDFTDMPKPLIDVLRGMINIHVAARLNINDVLESECFTDPFGTGDLHKGFVRRSKSRSLAGLTFISSSQDKSSSSNMSLKISSQMKSSGCLLSFAPAFSQDSRAGKPWLPRRSTFH